MHFYPSLQLLSPCCHLGGKRDESPLCPLVSSGSEGSGELRRQQGCGYWHHQGVRETRPMFRRRPGPLGCNTGRGDTLSVYYQSHQGSHTYFLIFCCQNWVVLIINSDINFLYINEPEYVYLVYFGTFCFFVCLFFNCRIIALQCCVGFCHKAT